MALSVNAVDAQTVYSNSFEQAVGPEWSRTQRDTTPIGARQFLGQFGNQIVTLSLTNLPGHNELELSFDLYIIRSWDGLGGNPIEIWSVGVAGGPALLRTTFTPFYQAPTARQSFPAWFGSGSFPANTGAAETFSLGYHYYVQRIYHWDAVYRLNFRVPHMADTLVVNFSATGLETLDNESWGLDNVVVTLDNVDPEAPPRITRQPQSTFVAHGGSAAFTVVTTANVPSSYQWQFNGVALPGQTNSFLIIAPALPLHAGFYSVVATNPFGSDTSEPARLTVGPPTPDPPPFDSIARREHAAALSWSSLGTASILESIPDLTSLGQWMPVNAELESHPDHVTAVVSAQNASGFFRLRSGPSLTDFWEGNAEWVEDAHGVGRDFALESPAMLRGDRDIWAYHTVHHSTDGQERSAVGRARSTDGLQWIHDGIALDVGGVPHWYYEAAQQQFIYHNVGRPEPNGWSANPALDGPGHMLFGPYTREIPGGINTAFFRLMIDQRIGPNDVVARLDVNDGDLQQVLAGREVRRNEIAASFAYQDFPLVFTSQNNQNLEFRVWFTAQTYVKIDHVAVAQGSAPHWDGQLASHAAVWNDGNSWVLVYQGTAVNPALSPGAIGVATSDDGRRFVRHQSNPILRHTGSGWESVSLGAPSLFREGALWHLFYSGLDGTTLQTGVATGSTLTSLTRHPGNPILNTVPGTWEAGAVGRRSSIVKEGPFYYLAYEGADGHPFSEARWSTGLARSTNLLDWVKFPANPILPQTPGGFGYDQPELVQLGGAWYLYVRMTSDPEAPTTRYRLAPK
jgi:hypothetical protein